MRFDPDKISILDGLEAVRHRPAMYVGDVTSPTLPARLLSQALCHAVDEAISGRHVAISLTGTNRHRACVAYDVGMPLDVDAKTRSCVALVFLTLHAACSNRKRHIDVGSAFCELGLAVMNACCSHLRLDVTHSRRRASFEFERGRLLSQQGPFASNDSDCTRMVFELDPDVLRGNTAFDSGRVNDELLRRSQEVPNLHVKQCAW